MTGMKGGVWDKYEAQDILNEAHTGKRKGGRVCKRLYLGTSSGPQN